MRSCVIKWRKRDPRAVLPQYHSERASGFDLRVHCPEKGVILVPPREVVCIPTGLEVEIPDGLEMQIRPRSGLSKETSLRLPNSPGTVDSDYRGEVGILVENTSWNEILSLYHGERIAQGVIVPVYHADHKEVEELTPTKRGSGGYGQSPEGGY